MKGMAKQSVRGAAVAACIWSALTMSASAETLTIGTAAEPKSMDPQLTALSSDLSYYRHVFNALVEPDDRLRPQPSLAESWQVVDDTTYEFHLREGVKFHDGTHFDATDVVYSFKRLPTVPNGDGLTAAKLKSIDSIEIVNPHVVRIHTKTPDSGVLRALGQFFILPSELGEVGTDDFNSGKATIGTGPFKFVDWVRGDRIEFARNEAFWGERSPFESVQFRFLSNSASRVAALRAGDVDLIDFVPPLDAPQIEKDPKLKLYKASAGRVIILLLDAKRDVTPFVTDKAGQPLSENPFKDIRVRQAIGDAVDRNLLVDKIMDGLAEPVGQPMPAGFGGYADDLAVPTPDVDRAQALMAQAGYAQGFKMTLHCTNGRYVNDTQICQAIAQMLSRINIEVSVDAMPPSAYFAQYKNAEFSAYILGWGNSSGDGSSILTSVVHSTNAETGRGSWNHHYETPELDTIISQALGTVDNTKREELYAEAMRKVMADASMIPLYAQLVLVATRQGIAYQPAADEATLAQNVTLVK